HRIGSVRDIFYTLPNQILSPSQTAAFLSLLPPSDLLLVNVTSKNPQLCRLPGQLIKQRPDLRLTHAGVQFREETVSPPIVLPVRAGVKLREIHAVIRDHGQNTPKSSAAIATGKCQADPVMFRLHFQRICKCNDFLPG